MSIRRQSMSARWSYSTLPHMDGGHGGTIRAMINPMPPPPLQHQGSEGSLQRSSGGYTADTLLTQPPMFRASSLTTDSLSRVVPSHTLYQSTGYGSATRSNQSSPGSTSNTPSNVNTANNTAHPSPDLQPVPPSTSIMILQSQNNNGSSGQDERGTPSPISVLITPSNMSSNTNTTTNGGNNNVSTTASNSTSNSATTTPSASPPLSSSSTSSSNSTPNPAHTSHHVRSRSMRTYGFQALPSLDESAESNIVASPSVGPIAAPQASANDIPHMRISNNRSMPDEDDDD